MIDDSASMLRHKEDLLRLLRVVVYLVKHTDEDGVDLYFARDLTSVHANNATRLVESVKQHKFAAECDITRILEELLTDYGAKLEKQHNHPFLSKVQPLNLYVFTDAVWTPTCNVVLAIDTIVARLTSLGKYEKQIGIQFISFGNIPDSLRRLGILDSKLGLPL